MDVKTKGNFFSKALLVFILAVSFLFAGGAFSDDSQDVRYGDVIINEVMWMGSRPSGEHSYHGGKDQWIELKNTTDKEIRLKGFYLKYFKESTGKENTIKTINEDVTIKAGEYFILSYYSEVNSAIEKERDIKIDYNFEFNKFQIKLYDNQGSIIDIAGDKSEEPTKGDKSSFYSMERKDDFGDGSIYSNWQTCYYSNFIKSFWYPGSTECGTPGAENSKENPPSDNGDGNDGETGGTDEGIGNGSNDDTCLENIRLNEIYPYPPTGGTEYVEIYNGGDKECDLFGWSVEDALGNSVKFGEKSIIRPSGYYYVEKNIGFNSDKETVYLKFEDVIKEEVSYSGAKRGLSYGFDGAKWRWSRQLTPGANNAFDEAPGFELKIDKKIYKNMPAAFEVKSKDEFKISWDFGDGKKSYKAETTHTYTKTGKYRGKVKVFGEAEEMEKEFEIEVKKFPDLKVRIVKINPNPPGADADAESIFVENKSEKEINLKGWSIASGIASSKLSNHPITEDLFVKEGKILEITREFSKFTLGNKKAKLELRYPDGEMADDVEYETAKDVKEGMIYEKKEGGGWIWKMGDIEVFENIEEAGIGQEGKIVGGFGFGEEEDALEIIEMLVEELERDLDAIYAQNDQGDQGVENVEIAEDVQGGQKVENVRVAEGVKYYDGISEKEKDGIFAKSVFVGNVPDGEPAVLGAQMVRAQGDEYRFTADIPDEPHYAAKFVRHSLIRLNASLNLFLRRFF